MPAARRTAIIRTIWAILFLLIALGPYLAVKLGAQDAAFVGVFLTPIFLAASALMAVGAITAGSRIADPHKRIVAGWSLTVVAAALAALILYLGSYVLAATPYCTDPSSAADCARAIGVPIYACVGGFVVISALAVVVAPITALVDAAQTRDWLWFTIMLLSLLLALAGLVSIFLAFNTFNLDAVKADLLHAFTQPDWLVVGRAAALLLLPLFALFYSLTGREGPKDA
jgi:hypothetical protein